MRNRFAEVFFDEARKNDKLTMCVADISPAGAMNSFREAFPDRFINTGVAEQSMIGICAGLAMGGFQPFAYTIATFAVFRPFEFIRDDICYQDLPVTIVGIGGGVTYSTLGGTHHAQEDISVLKSVPNIEIYTPCDPFETAVITTHRCRDATKPAYVRLGKAGEKVLSDKSDFKLGSPHYLREGEDFCIVGHGPILRFALEVANEQEKVGKSVSVVSFSRLKPVDQAGIRAILERYKKIVVLEELSPYNGLFSDFLFEKNRTDSSTILRQISLKDEFIHCYGSHEEVLSKHGITARHIAGALE